MLIVNIVTGNIKNLKNYKPKDYIITALIGLPGMFLYYVFFYTGTSMMHASQAFIVNYLWPIMSVVFACMLLKEKMTTRKMVAIAVSFLGVIITVISEIVHFEKTTLIGALCCVLGAVSYGAFTALNQKFKYDNPVDPFRAHRLNCSDLHGAVYFLLRLRVRFGRLLWSPERLPKYRILLT